MSEESPNTERETNPSDARSIQKNLQSALSESFKQSMTVYIRDCGIPRYHFSRRRNQGAGITWHFVLARVG